MSRKPEVQVGPPELAPGDAAAFRLQLKRLLTSHQFRGSRRCNNLLRHITECSLAGNTAGLKERALGADVFGRPPDYDTGHDPVVRTTAAEIRKKLAQYYQEPGREREPRIELLPGSYVVEFHLNGAASKPRSMRRRYRGFAGGLAAAVLLSLGLVAVWPTWSHSDLGRLWAPALETPGSVLVCVGQPAAFVYRSKEAQDAVQSNAIARAPDASRMETIPRKDLVVFPDRYVMLGDVACLLQLTSLLHEHGKSYHIRGDRATSYADLGENPAVLIGAFSNQWTLRTGDQLRYTFVRDASHQTDMVQDREHPEKTDWKLTGAWPTWDVPADYAIVTRLVHSTTGHPLMIAAGITQVGTMGAGEFLSDPECFKDAVPRLPRGWENKNIQIVLRVPVENQVAGRPRLLAVHTW
jgi:hypothetical protein